MVRHRVESPNFAPEQLRDKAWAAIEEAAERSKAGPVDRTKALAFALAYLWTYAGGERWPFTWFWQALAEKHDIGRSQDVRASLNAVRLALESADKDTSAG